MALVRQARVRGIGSTFAMAWLAACVLGGCASESPSPTRTAAAREALDQMTLSAPFELEPYPAELSTAPGSDPKMACGPSHCAVAYCVWLTWGSTPQCYAYRTTPTGAPIDLPHAVLSTGQPDVVGTVGEDFLVSIRPSSGYDRTFRIDGSTGAATDLGSLVPGIAYEIVEGQGTVMVAYRWGTANSVVILDAQTLAPVASAASLPFQAIAAAAGPGHYLLTDGTSFVRVNASTGALLDTTPITMNRYLTVRSASAVHTDGRYTVVFTDTGNASRTNGTVWAIRIADDGSLIDVDDTFNQITGARTICDRCSGNTSYAHDPGDVFAAVEGGQVLAFFTSRLETYDWTLYASRFDPATAATGNGNTSAAELSLGTLRQTLNMGFGSQGGVASNASYQGLDELVPLTLVPSPFGITRGSVARLSYTSSPRTNPWVASNGTDFLVVWATGDGRVVGSRIDGTTGQYLDEPVLAIGSGTMAAAAFDGTSYLVAFVRQYGNYVLLERRVVHVDGTMDARHPTEILLLSGASGASYVSGVRIAWNGKYHFVTYHIGQYSSAWPQVEGYRFGTDGTPIDTYGRDMTNAAVTTTYGMGGDTPADPTRRTFLTVFDASGIQIRRFRSESGSVIEPVTTLNSGGNAVGANPYLATDGTSFLVGWNESTTTYVGLVEPLNGTRVGAAVALGTTNQGQIFEIWHDGLSYVVATDPKSTAARELQVRRFDAALSLLDGAYGASGQWLFNLYAAPTRATFGVGSNGHGRTLIVAQEPSVDRHCQRLVGRFLDNTGTASAPLDAGMPADAGGASDAGSDASVVVSDAGVDAATPGPDGGVDAGSSDAGSSDAGADDASAPDAAVVDAGAMDAGASDASAGAAGDGGTSDASVPVDVTDAGTMGATSGGCSCSVGGASSAAGAMPSILSTLALVLVRVGRRRRHGTRR